VACSVTILPAAARELAALPRATERRLRDKIETLAKNPRPPGCTKMAGADDLWRIRVGDYRIIYAVHDDVLVVLIVKIGHRREVYRRR
jgi:mRNA interferase RelE/StbE